MCLVREKAAGLLLPGLGGVKPKKKVKLPFFTSFTHLSSSFQTHSQPVTVLGPGHMTADGGHVTDTHCEEVELTSDPTTDEASLGSRMAGRGVASSQEEGKR